MKIAHVQKTSFIDYPGKISAVIFTRGCNFRCPYCHNPELVDPARFTPLIVKEEVLSFLEKRRGKLDGVVITGGEPLLQDGLLEFLQRVKSKGFQVKLDTNGSRPRQLREAIRLSLVDFIAMDIKAPLERYYQIAGSLVNVSEIRSSIELIMGSSQPHEFRTTIARSLLSPDDIVQIAQMIRGASHYVLQKFVPSKHVDPSFLSEKSFTQEEIELILDQIRPMVGRCSVR
ncbi:MAG: anaerobic ribonucleoside-triphosphate reductase activating protein [Desulfomonilia bacterium]|nr:anaerobic ribonucleoside-triphosphate reductase activating protein [Desulfomonilia bacterium]